MSRLLVGISTVVLGTLGWYVGSPVGLFTAFVLSMVGTGVGLYAARRLAERWGA